MNYYIQGDEAKADQIKAAFEKLGYKTIEYCFNAEKTLYFTFGDAVKTATYEPYKSIIKTHPDYKELELPIEPKFKDGDDIKTGNTIETIAEVDYATRSYCCESGRTIWFENQDLWHLAPKPHYDISNFKPYQKVLIRFGNNDTWRADFFSHIKEDRGRYFVGIGYANKQCIPFEGNEHLLGTTDMCDEMYINW